MKTWTETPTLAALAATLTLAACTEDSPGAVSAVPDPEPGDPAIYAPDGWPLQIGDKVSWNGMGKVLAQFQVPISAGCAGGPEAGYSRQRPMSESEWVCWELRRSPWRAVTFGAHVVGNRVYTPFFDPLGDPRQLSESEWLYANRWVYRGHFRMQHERWMRPLEWHLPPEFHGKVEYQTEQDSRLYADYPERRK